MDARMNDPYHRTGRTTKQLARVVQYLQTHPRGTAYYIIHMEKQMYELKALVIDTMLGTTEPVSRAYGPDLILPNGSRLCFWSMQAYLIPGQRAPTGTFVEWDHYAVAMHLMWWLESYDKVLNSLGPLAAMQWREEKPLPW